MKNEVIRRRLDKTYREYRFSKERKDNLDKVHKITVEELKQRFTI